LFLSIFTRLIERRHQLGKWGLLCGTLLGQLSLACTGCQETTHDWSGSWGAHLPWATATALGGVTLEQLSQVPLALDGEHADTAHTGSVFTALLQDIGALLTVKLGANCQGNVHEVLQVLGGTLRASWALVILRLGIVHCATLGRLGDVLALTGHQNDAALGVQEPGGHGNATGAHLGSSLDVLEQRLQTQRAGADQLDAGSTLLAGVRTSLAQMGVWQVPVHLFFVLFTNK